MSTNRRESDETAELDDDELESTIEPGAETTGVFQDIIINEKVVTIGDEMKTWIITGVSVVLLVVGTFLVVNKVSPVDWGWWGDYNTSSGIALNGYDPVSYFNDEQPTQGNEAYSHQWAGVTWQFSSDENKELFAENPESYAPQFGGFCAFAVRKGFTADVSPDAWHIDRGKLYLFADQDVRDTWVTDLNDGSLQESSANWVKR